MRLRQTESAPVELEANSTRLFSGAVEKNTVREQSSCRTLRKHPAFSISTRYKKSAIRRALFYWCRDATQGGSLSHKPVQICNVSGIANLPANPLFTGPAESPALHSSAITADSISAYYPKFRSWMRRYGRKGQWIRIISAEGRYTLPV